MGTGWKFTLENLTTEQEALGIQLRQDNTTEKYGLWKRFPPREWIPQGYCDISMGPKQ